MLELDSLEVHLRFSSSGLVSSLDPSGESGRVSRFGHKHGNRSHESEVKIMLDS